MKIKSLRSNDIKLVKWWLLRKKKYKTRNYKFFVNNLKPYIKIIFILAHLLSFIETSIIDKFLPVHIFPGHFLINMWTLNKEYMLWHIFTYYRWLEILPRMLLWIFFFFWYYNQKNHHLYNSYRGEQNKTTLARAYKCIFRPENGC